MKITLKRILSVLVTACIVLSLAVATMPIGAADAASGTIIPLTDFDTADKYLQIFKVPDVPNGITNTFGAGAGIYYFDEDTEALTIKYADENDGKNYAICGVRYRFAIRVDSVDTIAADQCFMVVTYRTNATKSATMALDDYSGTSVVLESDVTVSDGQWVTTSPVDITGTLFTRMRNPNSHDAITVNITDFDKYFQLKEIAFFSSKEEANEYIMNTDFPEMSDTPTNEISYSEFPLYNLATAMKKLTVYNNSYITNADANGYIATMGEGQLGEYVFVDNQEAISLIQSAKNKYEFYFDTRSANMVGENEKYMVILYRTNCDVPGTVKFRNNSNGLDNLTLVPDYTVSNDKWVYSSPVNIDQNDLGTTDNLFARVKKSTLSPIIVDMPLSTESGYDKNDYFLIKNILFFSSKLEAEQFIAAAPDIPETKVEIDLGGDDDTPDAVEVEPVVWKYGSDQLMADSNAGIYIHNPSDVSGTWEMTTFEGVPAIHLQKGTASDFGTYRFMPKASAKGVITSDHRYMRVKYYVSGLDSDERVYLKMINNGGSAAYAVIPDDLLSNQGVWTVSQVVDLTEHLNTNKAPGDVNYSLVNRLANGSHVSFALMNVSNSAEVYISEIAFFGTIDDAYNHYKDEPLVPDDYLDGKLGDFTVITVFEGDDMGEWSYSDEDAFTLSYTDSNKYIGNYRMMYKFVDYKMIGNNKYIRVLYKADNGSAAASTLITESPATNERIVIERKVVNTNGEWVLSAPAELTGDLLDRLGGTGVYAKNATVENMHHEHNMLAFVNDSRDASYSIKNIYFFETLEDANAFVLPEDNEQEEDITDSVFEGTAPAVTPDGTISLKYDDHYTFDKEVIHIENVSITSSDPATGEMDVSVLKRVDGEMFAASAIGSANVYFADGTAVTVDVSAAPLNVFLLVGQSNTEGVEGNPAQSIRNTLGQVYSTYACAGYRYIDMVLDSAYYKGLDALSIYNSNVFIPAALAGDRNRIGTKLSYNLDELCEGGFGKGGIDSALAYEWNKQTGEKVWVINAAHAGSGIASWVPGNSKTNNNFWQAVGVMKSAEMTLQAEIAAGHYTLSHMGYYWLQGCTDRAMDPDNYTSQYMKMHNGFMDELAFDHDGDPNTPERNLEFGGILLVRTSDAHNAAADFYMKGPRLSQYYMGNENSGDYADIFVVSNITDIFKSDAAVEEYFVNKYATNENFREDNGGVRYDMPTTIKEVHPDVHYRQCGYNEIGRDAAYNTLCRLGEITPTVDEDAVEIKILGADGLEVDYANGIVLEKGESVTLVPVVSPRYANDVTYKATDSLSVDDHYTFKSADGLPASITFTSENTSVTVRINPKQPGTFTMSDVVYFARVLANWNGYVLPEDSSEYDLNSDGNVNSLDLICAVRHLAGWAGYESLPIVK